MVCDYDGSDDQQHWRRAINAYGIDAQLSWRSVCRKLPVRITLTTGSADQVDVPTQQIVGEFVWIFLGGLGLRSQKSHHVSVYEDRLEDGLSTGEETPTRSAGPITDFGKIGSVDLALWALCRTFWDPLCGKSS